MMAQDEPNMAKMAQTQIDNKMFVRMEALINSMTPAERRNPPANGVDSALSVSGWTPEYVCGF